MIATMSKAQQLNMNNTQQLFTVAREKLGYNVSFI
jgi:hypothetical protein